jgi:hypothetical protein
MGAIAFLSYHLKFFKNLRIHHHQKELFLLHFWPLPFAASPTHLAPAAVEPLLCL